VNLGYSVRLILFLRLFRKEVSRGWMSFLLHNQQRQNSRHWRKSKHDTTGLILSSSTTSSDPGI